MLEQGEEKRKNSFSSIPANSGLEKEIGLGQNIYAISTTRKPPHLA